MLILIYELLLSILLTALSIVIVVGFTYYVLLLFSILSGLIGEYSLSIYFTRKADILSTNIKNTFNIIIRKKK